ncbi:MAG: hypothetical protein GX621_06245 [Pirellulaceae bacterium]|nr:hypothetical protein [Pirellulaceae bacterium]
MNRRLAMLLTVVVLLSFNTSCGKKEHARYHVSGAVTFKGQPVPVGSIQFLPDASKGNAGPSAFAAIKNGRYDTRVDGVGTIGGSHVVTIDAFDGQNLDADVLPNGKPLARGFRRSFDLPTSGDTTLDIELAQ